MTDSSRSQPRVRGKAKTRKRQSRDAWHVYRFRRACFLFGLLGAAVGGAALVHLRVGTPVLLLFVLAAGWCVVFAGIWFVHFLCPECEHEWFGDGVEAEGFPSDLGAFSERSHRGGLGTIVSLAAQKLCGHCGLPKFADPTGWSEASTQASKDAQ